MLFESLSVLGLIAGSFMATNVDNLAMLVTWLLPGGNEPRKVFLGYLLGMSGLLALAIAFGLGAAVVPERHVGWLGLIPIGLGAKGLYEILRARGTAPHHETTRADQALVLAIAATQLANGVDTVLVVGPILADSELGVDLAMIGGFLVMVLLWFGLARFLETHAGRLAVIERYSHWVSPIVLIVIGLYILDNTGTDLLPGD